MGLIMTFSFIHIIYFDHFYSPLPFSVHQPFPNTFSLPISTLQTVMSFFKSERVSLLRVPYRRIKGERVVGMWNSSWNLHTA